ncbi:MAG TPA: hypothetical protein VK176_12360, partial [Phycisphaerales bacterium]|nr:hypothetical protein [Phycisphaerales bacterium]
DGASRLGFARGDDGFVDVMAMHAFAAELGKQGGVDVDDFAFESGRNADHFQIAREDDEVDGVGAEDFSKREGGDGAGDHDDMQAALLAALDAGARGACDDEGDASAEVASLDGVEEVEDGAAAA